MRHAQLRARHLVGVPRSAAQRAWFRAMDLLESFGISESAILLTLGVAVGAGTALGVVVFYKLIDLAFTVFYRWPETALLSRADFLAYRPLLTGAGLAAAWWVMRRLGRGHDGLNVPDVQLSVARRGCHVPLRPALARTAASAITIGSGGSAGSEGPVAVLGSSIGSLVGRLFRFGSSRVTVLVGAGAAAGISAAFNAPLAGAFFALEEILGTFAAGAFSTVVVSSVVAAVVSRAFFGNHPAFPIPEEYGYSLVREVVLFYPLLGILCGLVSALFVRCYFGTADLTARLRIPAALLPWVGGILVGAMVFLSEGLLVGYGHSAVQLSVFGRMAWYSLALLAVGKILATSLTLNTGGSGGVFTPTLYVGAATGGAVGVALAGLFPDLNLRPEPYALVGMGALIAGATNAPLTAILIVFEMTNDHAIILPLMLTTVISRVVARRFAGDSLYSGWLRRRGERLEEGVDRDVLSGQLVADAFERHPRAFRAEAPVTSMLEGLGHGEQVTFPVLGPGQVVIGVVTTGLLGRVARDRADELPALTAGQIAEPTEVVTPGATLLETIRLMGARGLDALPVVHGPGHELAGLVTRGHILALYERTVAARTPARADPAGQGRASS